MIKAQLATIGFLMVLFLLTGVIIGVIALYQYSIFQKSSGIKTSEFISLLHNSWKNPPNTKDDLITILVLGLDEVAARNQTALTDTIMLLSLNTKTGTINLLSLPRDLWVEEYQTKINALYFYSQKNNPIQPTQFVMNSIESITGTTIDRVVPITLEQIAELVNAVHGLEITVSEPFVDEHFPRPNIDPSKESDITVLQQTVAFEKGVQTMDGARVLEYIRSRQSEGVSGSDDSRTQRQQQVLLALVNKLQSKAIILNPKVVGSLVTWYKENFDTYWSISDLLSIGFEWLRNDAKIELSTHSLSIAPKNTTDGILMHPPTWRYQNQWVYVATESASFKNTIYQMLYVNTKPDSI